MIDPYQLVVLKSWINVGYRICGELLEIKEFDYHVEWFGRGDWRSPDNRAKQESKLRSCVKQRHLFL